jgi:N-acetylglutamate synthase-like GNAT family acetyltransferase
MGEATTSQRSFHDLRIRAAGNADVEALAALINNAFRVELPFIEGDRINPGGVREYMKKGQFLLAEDSSGLVGCVYVELRSDRGYLGLLGVEPRRQGSGLGRKLMSAGEIYFRDAGCVAVDLRIVSARTPLPAFYRHLGYVETGTAPFPHDVPAKVPCHYILMSKSIAQVSATPRQKNEPGSGS